MALQIKPNFSQSLNNLGVVYTVQVGYIPYKPGIVSFFVMFDFRSLLINLVSVFIVGHFLLFMVIIQYLLDISLLATSQ